MSFPERRRIRFCETIEQLCDLLKTYPGNNIFTRHLPDNLKSHQGGFYIIEKTIIIEDYDSASKIWVPVVADSNILNCTLALAVYSNIKDAIKAGYKLFTKKGGGMFTGFEFHESVPEPDKKLWDSRHEWLEHSYYEAR